MRHHLLVAAAALTGLLFAPACSSAGAPDRVAASAAPSARVEDPSSSPEGAALAARVVDTDFAPPTIQAEIGASVQWEQVGDQPHSVTAADGSFDSSPDCGPLDSEQCLGTGDTFVHAFDTAGKFAYYCRVHGLPDGTGMAGTVVVR